jgi:hypothetical protein
VLKNMILWFLEIIFVSAILGCETTVFYKLIVGILSLNFVHIKTSFNQMDDVRANGSIYLWQGKLQD